MTNNTMVSHSGETLSRARSRAPWTPTTTKPSRGSLSLAMRIAKSPELTAEAEANFRALNYAPSTSAGKEALFSAWSALYCALQDTDPSWRTSTKLRIATSDVVICGPQGCRLSWEIAKEQAPVDRVKCKGQQKSRWKHGNP